MIVRGMTHTLASDKGVQKYVRQPMMIDGQGGIVDRLPPELGQHNAELLSQRVHGLNEVK
jgi:hypothetical protein